MPFASFLVLGLVAAFVQRAFVEAVAQEDGSLRLDEEVASDLRRHPARLPVTIASETGRRLRALLTPSRSPRIERRRRLALAADVAALACFVWFFVVNVRFG